MATPTAHIGAQGQNDIDRNIRQYKDLDLFLEKNKHRMISLRLLIFKQLRDLFGILYY